MELHAPADLANVLVRFSQIRSLAVEFNLIRVITAAQIATCGLVYNIKPPACFDPLWVIFREEPRQSFIYKTIIMLTVYYCLHIVEFLAETEIRRVLS